MSATQHQLGDPASVRRIVAGLAPLSPEQQLEELGAWLAALHEAVEIAPAQRWSAVQALHAAAGASLDGLAQACLDALERGETGLRRPANLIQAYWRGLAAVSEDCLHSIQEHRPGHEPLLAELAGIAVLAIRALRMQIKWSAFVYAPLRERVWAHMGAVLALAERAEIADKPVPAPDDRGLTSARLEYTRAMALEAADTDGLRPLEIELAERLVDYFADAFGFGYVAESSTSHWVDLASGLPPARFQKAPATLVPGLRFFKLGKTGQALQGLLDQVTLDGALPAGVDLGRAWSLRLLKRVLRHLALHFSADLPRRRHVRFPLKGQLRVAAGLSAAQLIFAAGHGDWPEAVLSETWEIENASQGGCAAHVRGPLEASPWLTIGALLVSQSVAGGPNLLGIVRRLRRETDGRFRVGVETLGRDVQCLLLVPLNRPGQAAGGKLSGLLLPDGDDTVASVRLLLPRGSFALREVLAYVNPQGRLCRLQPEALLDSGDDYEWVRYRRLG